MSPFSDRVSPKSVIRLHGTHTHMQGLRYPSTWPDAVTSLENERARPNLRKNEPSEEQCSFWQSLEK